MGQITVFSGPERRRRWSEEERVRILCGSDRGGQRAAIMYSLIGTAKLNARDPQAWLADILARIAGHPVTRLDDLLPWNWRRDTGVLSQGSAEQSRRAA